MEIEVNSNERNLRSEVILGVSGVILTFVLYALFPIDMYAYYLTENIFHPEVASSAEIRYENNQGGYYSTVCMLILPEGNLGQRYGCWGYPRSPFFYYIFVFLFGVLIPIWGAKAIFNLSVLTMLPRLLLLFMASCFLGVVLTVYVHNFIPTVMYALFDVPPTQILYGEVTSGNYPYPTLFNNGIVYFIINTFQIVFFGVSLTALIIIFGLMIDPFAVWVERAKRKALSDIRKSTQDFKDKSLSD